MRVGESAVEVLREQVPATAGNVGRLRRLVRRWLSAVLDDVEVVEELTTAVSEAVENAVDHAYVGAAVGLVLLEARMVPGAAGSPAGVRVTVSDDGRWQAASAPGFRGRGLALIASCCPGARVESDTSGTRVVLHHPFRPSGAGG